jgi:putative ABC transport system ATP-binding protein
MRVEGAPAATCESVVKVYPSPGGDVMALAGVDATFAHAAVTALVGPSGSGKSSLLRILAGLDRPTAGRVVVGGIETSSLSAAGLRSVRRRAIAYVWQRPAENLIGHLTVAEHLRLSARARQAGRGWVDRAREILDVLGLDARVDHLPRQLSGGEQQRVAFATAVVGEPSLVVADEPTGELDSASAEDVLAAVRALADRGTAFAIATHDPAVVAVAERTYHLRHGSLEAESTADRPLAVIDHAGRIQLPPAWRDLFPDARAHIQVDEDGLRILPP